MRTTEMTESAIRLVSTEEEVAPAPARPITQAQQVAQAIRDRIKAAYVATAEARTLSDLSQAEDKQVEAIMQSELAILHSLDKLIAARDAARGRA